MSKNVIIFGKETCPYTNKACEIYARRGFTVEYLEVTKDEALLQQMLVYTEGKRVVPVIVEGENVSIGYGGT